VSDQPEGLTVNARWAPLPVNLSVEAHLDEYLALLLMSGKAAHTVDSTRLDLRQLSRFLGRQSVGTVTPDDLRAFFARLSRQQGNGVSSLRRKTSTVKQFFRHLRAEGTLERDPSATLVYPAIAARHETPLTAFELDAIVEAAGNPIWRALVLILVDTGLKRDEMVALRSEDVELPPSVVQPGRLHVRHRRATSRVRQRTLALKVRLADALRPQIATAGASTVDPGGRSVLGLSARGVDFVVETCGRRAGARPDQKVTPRMLGDGFACARVGGFVAVEDDLPPESSQRRELQRENDRLLVRELGLSDRSDVAERYRSMLGRLEPDRAEEGGLHDAELAAPDQLQHGE
jgi:site-specific recombinase XerD